MRGTPQCKHFSALPIVMKIVLFSSIDITFSGHTYLNTPSNYKSSCPYLVVRHLGFLVGLWSINQCLCKHFKLIIQIKTALSLHLAISCRHNFSHIHVYWLYVLKVHFLITHQYYLRSILVQTAVLFSCWPVFVMVYLYT